MIENLGSKLYSGTKSDRKSDSLGSSADGANISGSLGQLSACGVGGISPQGEPLTPT